MGYFSSSFYGSPYFLGLSQGAAAPGDPYPPDGHFPALLFPRLLFPATHFPGLGVPSSLDWYEAVFQYLTTRLELPGGIHRGALPDNQATWPCLSYWLINSSVERVLSGGPIETNRLQFTLFSTDGATDRANKRALQRALLAVKRPDRLAFQGGAVARADLLSAGDDFGRAKTPAATKLWEYRADYEFKVHYYEE